MVFILISFIIGFIIGIFTLYKKYILEIIYNVAYFLAFIPYYLNIRHKIIVGNLKFLFPDISDKRIDYIRFHSCKYFIINIIICLNQYIFSNSFLKKYYSVKHIDIPHKSLIILAHFGLYYDFTGFQELTGKSLYGIYKGKFEWKINNKYIVYRKHNNINLKELNKYFIVTTPIDQKSDNKTIVKFLGQWVKFHSKLIDFSIKNNRDIYFYNVIIKNYRLELTLTKIDTKNKPLVEIVQDIAYKFTDLIKQNPEQYLWYHNRFNIK